MTAKDARALSEKATDPTTGIIADLIAHAHQRIEQAAKRGYLAITNPLTGLRTNVSCWDEELVYKHLRSEGYTVKSDSDQREGKSWVTVSW